MEPGNLWKKAVLRVLTSTPNVAVGGAAVVASLALANPLPLILYGLGAGVVTLKKSQDPDYLKRIVDEESAAREIAARQSRSMFRDRLATIFASEPLATWIEGGLVPDYMAAYKRLSAMRDRVVQIAHDRSDVAQATEEDIEGKLDGVLAAFLRLAQSRSTYLLILTGQQLAPAGHASRMGRIVPKHGAIRRVARFFIEDDEEERQSVDVHHGDCNDCAEYEVEQPRDRYGRFAGELDLEREIERIGRKIAEVRQKRDAQPSAAKQYEEQAKILEAHVRNLQECKLRDQRVAAQLETFETVLESILTRVQMASQFQSEEFTQYLGEYVSQVEETQRFAEEMQTSMDSFQGLDVQVPEAQARA